MNYFHIEATLYELFSYSHEKYLYMLVNEPLKRAINEIKFKSNINQADIADKLGIRSTYLSDMINGRVPLSDNITDKIYELFHIVIEEKHDVEPILQETPMYYGGDMIILPLIPMDAVAGFPGFDNNGITIADCEQYSVPEFSSKGAEFLIRVSGSSMYPKYSNGDLLACKKIPEITFFQWGKIYVLDTIQGALVKRLLEDVSNNDNIICQSDNKDKYPPFSLPKSEIRSLSIVLGVIRME